MLLDVVCSGAQLSPILSVSMDCSPSGSSVHGIIPGRRLERVAISSSRGSSQPSDYFLHLLRCRQIIYPWATRKPNVGWGKDYSWVSSSLRQLIAILKRTTKSIIFSETSYPIYALLPQDDKQRLYAIQYLLFSSLIFQNGCIILIGKFYANDVKQETLGICSRSFRKPRAGTSRRTQGAETENWSAWTYPVCFWGAMQLFVLFFSACLSVFI